MKLRWVLLITALVIGAMWWFGGTWSTTEPTPPPVITTSVPPSAAASEKATVGVPMGAAEVEGAPSMEVNSEGETYPPLPPVAHPEGADTE